MSYVIELGNGKVLEGVELSGNTFMTHEAVERKDFGGGGLRGVKISGPDSEEGGYDPRGEYALMELDGIFKVGEWTCFVLNEGREDEEYYERGYWSESRVRDAVEKGKLSEAEYEEITGKEY